VISSKRVRIVLVLVGMFVLAVGLAAAASFHPKGRALAWRFEVVKLKATDNFGDVTWNELAHLVRLGSGFSMNNKLPVSPAAIVSSLNGKQDLAAGAALFRTHCAACHGADAKGTGHGPALTGVVLTRARTDWMTYQTISKGIAGTSMPPHALAWKDLWRLVAHVESISTHARQPSPHTMATVEVSPEDLGAARARPHDWLTYSGTYDGHRFSDLKQIATDNVHRLQVAWIHPFSNSGNKQQTVPLVANGIMYFTEAPATVIAADATTGKAIWRYEHPVPADARSCCGRVNRGLALLGGQLFLGTIDAHLIAIDAATGEVNWDRTLADYREDFSITAAPLAVNDLVVVGSGGGDYATSGFIAAFKASDGSPVWRFNTIPSPGEPGNDTWEGDSWKTGGAAPWMTGSYDPASNTVYWGTGNPAPDYAGDARKGDNLYSNSVVALDATTGTRRWHFQFTPHDTHDWDSAQVPILIDDPSGPAGKKLISWANRNGLFYSLDAATGKFIQGRAYARQTWSEGLDASGRPKVIPGSDPSPEGSLVWPNPEGVTNWWPPAYDRELRQLYVPVIERPGIYFSEGAPKPKTGEFFFGTAAQSVDDVHYSAAIRALDPLTGELRWEHKLPVRETQETPELGGLLATSGGLVFGSDRTVFYALDARTGKRLWSFDAGARMIAPPITYQDENRQMVVIATEATLLSFALGPSGMVDSTS
jgi:alcohol dehydrogenase (cytochrome c)